MRNRSDRGCRVYKKFRDGVNSRFFRSSDLRECSTESNDQSGVFLDMSNKPGEAELEHIWRHHTHEMKEHQCGSILVKHIHAPVNVVRRRVFQWQFLSPRVGCPCRSSCSWASDLEIFRSGPVVVSGAGSRVCTS